MTKREKRGEGGTRPDGAVRGATLAGSALLFGGLLGLLLVLMKLMEFSYLTRDLTMEGYLLGVAVLFLVVGGLLGRRFMPVRDGRKEVPAGGGTDADVRTSPELTRSAPYGDLSDREIEILELVARGRTNREIADELFLSPNTIKSHVSNIYRKLDVARRPEAVARAKELAILE